MNQSPAPDQLTHDQTLMSQTLAAPLRAVRPNRSVLSSILRMGLGRSILMGFMLCLLVVGSARVLAQQPTPTSPSATTPQSTQTASDQSIASGGKVSLMALFKQSFDLFTVLLVVGSLAGWAIIFMCIIEVRESNIAPPQSDEIISSLIRQQRWADLRQFVQEDDALVSKALAAGINVPFDDKDAIRDAAEMAASQECARWFRKVEPLNVLGNLGPLLGLAGTVWGMILAFAALQSTQGQASPATLSGGIAKALFHTLLGLLLAVPCLSIYGFYRSFIDKLCTKALVTAGSFVEMLPREARVRFMTQAASPAASQPRPSPTPVSPTPAASTAAGPR